MCGMNLKTCCDEKAAQGIGMLAQGTRSDEQMETDRLTACRVSQADTI